MHPQWKPPTPCIMPKFIKESFPNLKTLQTKDKSKKLEPNKQIYL